MRVHRHRFDRIVTVFHRVHRYRCSNRTCGWEGLVGSYRPTAELSGSLSMPASADGRPVHDAGNDHALWFASGVLAAVLSVATVELSQIAGYWGGIAARPNETAVPAAGNVAPGESYDGLQMSEDDLRVEGNETTLTLRRACAWGVPGRNPYLGTVTQALSAARLPADIVEMLAAKVRAGESADRVQIDRNAIRAVRSGRLFSSELPAMAYGNTLCFNTRVNFPLGHTEAADLYEVRSNVGARYTIMVPYVCGNVSVLDERIERDDDGRRIPQPVTWVLVVTGLGALAAVMYLRPPPPGTEK